MCQSVKCNNTFHIISSELPYYHIDRLDMNVKYINIFSFPLFVTVYHRVAPFDHAASTNNDGKKIWNILENICNTFNTFRSESDGKIRPIGKKSIPFPPLKKECNIFQVGNFYYLGRPRQGYILSEAL